MSYYSKGETTVEIHDTLLKAEGESQAFLLAEYNTLRDEILRRIEAQEKAISLTLLIFGTILGFGLQNHSPLIILLYPIISTFLASIWVYNTVSIKKVALYIKDEIENKIDKKNMGWESRTNILYRRPLAFFLSLAIYGVFLGTPISAIFVVLLIFSLPISLTEIFLLLLALCGIICSGVIITLASPQHA
jgi:hypothetical protein